VSCVNLFANSEGAQIPLTLNLRCSETGLCEAGPDALLGKRIGNDSEISRNWDCGQGGVFGHLSDYPTDIPSGIGLSIRAIELAFIQVRLAVRLRTLL
jgi:hypothetical protein